METTYKTYRQEKIRQGNEYVDWVTKQLLKHGIVLQPTTSRKAQWAEGESLSGWEIKNDTRISSTGRIYIETHEKAVPRNGEYVSAGIYRNDNSWLYAIGNCDVLYVFSKKTLQRLDKLNPSWLYRPLSSPTSRGFCIPIEQAEEIAEKVFLFSRDAK